jgi:uncharacterized protein (DUF302 family)
MSSNTPSDTAGVTSQPSPHSVDETLQRLEQVIRHRGLTLFAHFDHSGEAARVGLAMQPAHVARLWQPAGGDAADGRVAFDCAGSSSYTGL